MAVIAFLASCELSQPYGTPQFPFLPGYARSPDNAPVLLSNDAWWEGLDDPVLNTLIDHALADNLSLALARERVIMARAARDGVPGATILTSSADTGVTGTSPALQTTVQAGLSWMIDPYGTRADELRVAQAGIDIADAETDAARLLVLFNTSSAFVRLRHNQRLLVLARDELQGRLDMLALTRTMENAEEATRLDITRSRARIAEIRTRLPDLEAAVAGGLNEIAVLAGAMPGTLPDALEAALANGAGQPLPGLSPDVGIPTDLLRNRPDILIAERQYYSAVTSIGIARADLYPRLSLSGTITLNALSSSGSRTEYYFGPAVQFPAFPTTSARAGIEQRLSQARQAHVRWMSTVLAAILEVENALVDYAATTTALRSAVEASRLYDEAETLTSEVFRNGEATLGDLIDAAEATAAAERTLANLRQDHALRFVALNVYLGAGNAVSRPAEQRPE